MSKKVNARPQMSKMKNYHDRMGQSEQFNFVNRGGSDNEANTATMSTSSLKVRKYEVINGKKYAVIS